MTVIATEESKPRKQYTYSTSLSFPITFSYIERNEVKCMINDTVLVYNTDYTVPEFDPTSLADDQLNLTLIIVPTVGDTVTIYRETKQDQQAVFPQNAKFSSQKITEAVDKLTMICQELSEDLETCIQLPKETPIGFNTTLPTPEANQVIQWNEDGTQLINYDLRSEISTIDSKVNSAVSDASTALNKANEAISTANTAENKATTALNTADSASTLATQTKETVDKYEQDIIAVQEAAEKINELEEAVTTATEAAQTASDKADIASDKADIATAAAESAQAAVQSDWNVTDNTARAYIKNKPTIPDISGKADKSLETTQNIQTTTSTISLVSDKSIYSITPSGNTTFTFSITNLNISSSVAYTFELCVNMSTAYALTFPASVTWQDATAPDMSSTGLYFLVFRTIDSGTTWLGNLQGKW